MSIFSDNSSLGDLFSSKDINIFQDDELYIPNPIIIDQYFSHGVLKDEEDIKEAFTKVFQTYPLNFEDQATNFETKKKDNNLLVNNSPDNSDIKIPKSFFFEDIQKIVKQKYNESSKFTKDEKIEKYENVMYLYDINLLQNKRNRSKNKGNENIIQFERGRKKKDDVSQRKHDKYSLDNIMKKIKAKIIEIAIDFINKIVNKNKEESKKILFKKIDYKYINQMKQDLDIELLNGPLKNLLLKDISKKYSNLSTDSNRINLEKLIKNEKNDETIMFVLNLPLRDFIELYCSKKTLNDIEMNIDSGICKNIMDELPGIDSLLNDILKKNGGKYLSHFIFILYNYEKTILIKKGRNSKKPSIEINIIGEK
jgi:hypothetical protein